MRVKDLDVKALAFCVKSGFTVSKSIIPIQNSDTAQGKPIKVYFEKNCNLVHISENSIVKQLLESLSVKYGYLNPDEYQFKVAVQVEELTEQECDITMDLKIGSLTTDELKLYRKVYVDTPSYVEDKKQYTTVKEDDGLVRYDNSRYNMTRAQASTYKQYEVIKTNAKGKRQKRILGIDQLRLYNMTALQAKEKVGGKALEKAERSVIRKKLASLFKSVTHHPEIPIESIHLIEQDSKNLCCFYIDYTENGTKKRKLYETEKSSIAVEIISKITKLMLLVIFI